MKTGPQNPQTPKGKKIAYLMWYSHLELNHNKRTLIRQIQPLPFVIQADYLFSAADSRNNLKATSPC